MENEITRFGKIIAGMLLIILTTSSIIFIIGYWPDKLPIPGSHLSDYSNRLFHIRLLDTNELAQFNERHVRHIAKKVNDSALLAGVTDSARRIFLRDSAAKVDSGRNSTFSGYRSSRTIDLNTILIVLVAIGGFLGNMIHIATSFTTFVGAGQFKRSWILWYCVKPFTASALAITLYFAFRAGFLNYSNDASNINLFGTMTLAIMAGLFTDMATEKLKEIFEVTFRPKEVRPDPLVPKTLNITSIKPDKLNIKAENTIQINGTGLDQTGLIFKINSEVIKTEPVQPTLVAIKYSVPATQIGATSFKLEVINSAGKVVQEKVFGIE
ncbi:MAG TPA: hypothetical protein VK772_10730 [Puia sp.]|jgi:hypothetical protein|nr:hypothetical protein [Puia sp.]